MGGISHRLSSLCQQQLQQTAFDLMTVIVSSFPHFLLYNIQIDGIE